MKVKNYELIEHTADIGIRVKGKDVKELFQNVALAMFDIIAERKPETSPSTKLRTGTEQGRSASNQPAPAKRSGPGKPVTRNIIIKQKADDLEELFINWLNELLFLSATKELIFSDFKIDKLDKNNLQATAVGEAIKNYRVNTEIKAATYHQLQLKQSKSGWLAEVIFDV